MISASHKGIFIACGHPREELRLTLEQKLGCPVFWPALTRKTRIARLLAYLGRVDVLVVGRFVNHAATNRLIRHARKRGITVIQLTGGYSPGVICSRLGEQDMVIGGSSHA